MAATMLRRAAAGANYAALSPPQSDRNRKDPDACHENSTTPSDPIRTPCACSALEKGIELPLQEIDVMGGEHRRPPYSDLNPMMQTPALETDDGQVIVEPDGDLRVPGRALSEPAADRRHAGRAGPKIPRACGCGASTSTSLRGARAPAGRPRGGPSISSKIKLLSEEAARGAGGAGRRSHPMAGRADGRGGQYSLRRPLHLGRHHALLLHGVSRCPTAAATLPKGCKHLPAWFERMKARPAAQATNGD